MLQAVVWTIVRGDAAAAAAFADEIAGYPDGPLRDVVLGSLAMAAEDPAAAEAAAGRGLGGAAHRRRTRRSRPSSR